MFRGWGENMAFTMGMVAATGGSFIWRSFRHNIPTRWRTVGNLECILTYPFLNGDPLERHDVRCTHLGLLHTDKYAANGCLLIVAPTGAIYTVSNKAFRLGFNVASHEAMILLNVPETAKQGPVMDLEVIATKERSTYILNGRLIDLIDCGDAAAQSLMNCQGSWSPLNDPSIPQGSRIKYYPWQRSRDKRPGDNYTELFSVDNDGGRSIFHEDRSTVLVFLSQLSNGITPRTNEKKKLMKDVGAHFLVNDTEYQRPPLHDINWIKIGPVVYRVNKDKTEGITLYLDCVLPAKSLGVDRTVQIDDSLY